MSDQCLVDVDPSVFAIHVDYYFYTSSNLDTLYGVFFETEPNPIHPYHVEFIFGNTE